MKLSILSLLLLFNSNLWSQYSSNLEEVDLFITRIDSINNLAENKLSPGNVPDPVKMIIQEINISNLKHMASLMFKASDLAYVYLWNLGIEQYRKVKDSPIPWGSGINLGGTTQKFQRIFNEKISPLIYGLTRIAYLLKIKVIAAETNGPKEEGWLPGVTPIIYAEIETVFKGTGRFKSGDSLQFYYYQNWLNGSYSFEVGKEYLVPLEPRSAYPMTNNSRIALVTYLDESTGYYPIFNGNIEDMYNYFGFGEILTYDQFEQKLQTKIEELKSW